MKNFLPVLLKDAYKIGHVAQYPKGTSMIYSNITPRSSRVEGVDGVIACGMQYFVKEYLRTQFNDNFFDRPLDVVMKAYKRRVDNMLGPGTNIDHIANLHELGYLPLHIKALPEGTLCPLRVPFLTIRNTHKDFFWLTNMVESLMSNVLWGPTTSATTAFGYRQTFEAFAKKTGADPAFIQWQGHDFSMRGMMGIEAACLSAFGHLLSFTGTDTVPVIDFCEEYYGANSDTELIGGSVPATEHSVMCMGLADHEFETFQHLVTEVYPKGVVSIVSDSWDFWQVVTDYLPRLKEAILARDGKVVIRPDSGDPVKILCGDPGAESRPVRLGLIRMLWETFEGTVNAAGFRVLDPHIGAIYGDSITQERQREILGRLLSMGFASSNVVLGIGSYTYQMVTRDTYGIAIKATYGEIDGVGREIFKDPKTDDGMKKSAKGLLRVERGFPLDNGGAIRLRDQCTWQEERGGFLVAIFVDGFTPNSQTLAQIRKVVASQL